MQPPKHGVLGAWTQLARNQDAAAEHGEHMTLSLD